MTPLSIEDALAAVLASALPLEAVRLPLAEAEGAVLAEEVRADGDVPSATNSAMDGFAVRAADVAAGGALPLDGDSVAAGAAAPAPLRPGAARRIMTGAPLPEGADAVVPVEEAAVEADGRARFAAAAAAGAHVRRAGEDMRAGAVILRPGTPMTPAAVSAAATAGRAAVAVRRRPRVAVLATGDEIVAPDAPMRPGLVRNANGPCLAALLRENGCEALDLGVARDDAGEIAARLDAAGGADAILTSGGVSMGERDLVRGVLEARGMSTRFWKVRVKPGRPLLFGTLGGRPVFGIPGNPVTTFVTFEIFVRPALRRMAGHARVFRSVVPVTLAEEIRRSPGRPEFLRVRLERRGDSWLAAPTRAAQGSGIVTSLIDAGGLLYAEAGVERLAAGTRAACVMLSGPDCAEFHLGSSER